MCDGYMNFWIDNGYRNKDENKPSKDEKKAKLKQVQKKKADAENAKKQSAKRYTHGAPAKGDRICRLVKKKISFEDQCSYSVDKHGCSHDSRDM